LSNHTPPLTKKQRIKDLLLAGVRTKDIVDRVGTTTEYVYKEKGFLKKEGLLVAHQSLSMSDGKSEIIVVKDQPQLLEKFDAYAPMTSYSINDYDIPRFDRESARQTYKAFEEQKTPTQVIAESGIHPKVAQQEFERFLEMKSRDPYDLQKKLISGISNGSLQIQSIIDKLPSNLLTNDELIQIIEFKMRTYANSHLKNVVLFPANEIPDGLEKVTCMICHVQLDGVLYAENTPLGLLAKQSLSEILCENCKLNREDIALRKGLVP